MLLTQKARNEYPNTTKLALILTESDVVNKGRMRWTADVPVLDPEVIHIGRLCTKCHLIEHTDDIFIDISSFKAEYHPNLPGIKRNSPQLPPQLDPLDPTDLYMEHSLYTSQTFGIHPIESSDSQDISTEPSGLSPASESEESRKMRAQMISNHRCDLYPGVLEIRGGPDILYRNKLHISNKLSPEIFEVPRRGSAGAGRRGGHGRGRRKQSHSHSRSSSVGYGSDLIPSVIDGLAVDPSGLPHVLPCGDQQCKITNFVKSKDVETRVTPGLRGYSIPNVTRINPLDIGDKASEPSPSETEEENVRVIILYEGYDYGREALMIACTTFVLIFILSCIGFGCIIAEQMQINKRKISNSSARNSPSTHGKMSPQRRRKCDLY